MSNSTLHATGGAQGTERRRARLSTLAKAQDDVLRALWEGWLEERAVPAHEVLRSPEIGTVMVRGRAGATGAPFNLGEMTVARASVRLGNGTVGHGHVQGRSKDAALIAALVDALSEAGEADALDAAILAPLRRAAEARRTDRAEKAAATRVEFFTMVRGDNA
ncbi:phosphonate C-P lyase system protein PhnG [Roseibacterium sp. SDUM158017]|uniref:phosphonate C-P lyase system protein PhnG n=1 Tax=Roseicyclus salinarum TaxID=3036773 RepID=UPI00241544FB|nr:phosphonate C-P lyase system protein PhnG [Roseibacterium sp. SDUM158017]MDG4650154.1 phosphonate C-P lyase system protein PhnG [Roseibacterium sp. SDUM158017]